MNQTQLAKLYAGASALILPVLLVGCASYASVKEVKPRLALDSSADSQLAKAGMASEMAQGRYREEPAKALAVHLETARISGDRLSANPADAEAMMIYNFAVSRVVEVLSTMDKEGLNPWSGPLQVDIRGAETRVTHRKDKRKLWDPALYRVVPVDRFEVSGQYVQERTTRPGIGAPVVAIPKGVIAGAREEFAPDKPYAGVTAMLRFAPGECEIAFEGPLAAETTKFAGRTFPLAADFTVPLAAMLDDKENNPKKLGFARYFNPGKFDKTAEVARLEPWDPDKTVVLVIHGLTDSQATWTPLINTARGDEFIRRNFQFWFFSYPSGYPYPHSATLLRKELDAAFAKFPPKKPIIVIGHSMGGCVSRLLITDVGDRLWEKLLGEPPAESRLSQSSRELLEPALIFKHRPEIGRVIFMSAPLKGSEFAEINLGRLAASLIKMPAQMVGVGRDMLRLATFQTDELRLRRLPNSVDTLAPNNRFVKAINMFPVTEGIPHHVVFGDRGRGDAPDSSDGIVPYWSSHMDTALSEKAVPSGHATHQHPEGIAEVLRILRLHAQSARTAR